MSFFDEAAREPEPKRERPKPPIWLGPPPGVLPATSVQRAVLARSDSAIVVADHFRVYPSGVTFALDIMVKNEVDGPDHGPPFDQRLGRNGPSGAAGRFGILFGDGTTWTNLDRWPDRNNDDVSGPVVVSQGGGGGGGRWNMRYWMWPLPPPGELTFVLAWPAQGIEERRIAVDGDELRAQAELAEIVWTD